MLNKSIIKYYFLKAKRFNKKNFLKNTLSAFKTLTFIKMDFFTLSIMIYCILITKHLLLNRLKMPSVAITRICETLSIMDYISHFAIIIII